MINTIRPFVYYFKPKTFNIFDPIFKLHTKLTVYFLLICSIVVSSHVYSGRPIDCINAKPETKLFAETICWASGTFTEPKEAQRNNGSNNVRQYQRYYQWIILILLVQAAIFSIPERLWKVWEHGRMQQLCNELNVAGLTRDDPAYKRGKDRIVSYLKMRNSRIHGSYVFRYVCCEVMNFLNVVLNMYILNALFGQFWLRYLPAIVSLLTTGGSSFSELAWEIFPITAKCLYSDYGPSGSTQTHDLLCLLTLNVINEKVFAFLYIWYVFLLFMSGGNLLWRSLILLSSSLRLKMIQSSTKWTEPLSVRELKKVFPKDNIGDWFIIYLLGQNLNRFVFRDILNEIANSKEPLNNDA